MTKSIILPLVLVSMAAIAGCDKLGGDSEAPVRTYKIQVDTSLPPAAQARQFALRKFLNAVVEGVEDQSGLSIYAPGIDFRGKYEQLNGTSGRLVRWEFNGQPSGNDVPVALFYAEQATGLVDFDHLQSKDQKFAVVPEGRRFSIMPK